MLEIHLKEDNEIEVESMPVGLQAYYCTGKYKEKIIACNFYEQSICLNTCRYAKVMNKFKQEKIIIEMAGQSLECSS